MAGISILVLVPSSFMLRWLQISAQRQRIQTEQSLINKHSGVPRKQLRETQQQTLTNHEQ